MFPDCSSIFERCLLCFVYCQRPSKRLIHQQCRATVLEFLVRLRNATLLKRSVRRKCKCIPSLGLLKVPGKSPTGNLICAIKPYPCSDHVSAIVFRHSCSGMQRIGTVILDELLESFDALSRAVEDDWASVKSGCKGAP